MNLFLGLIIPTLVILTPIIILTLIGARNPNIDRTEFGLAIFGCFVFGMIVPILATMISAYGLTYDAAEDEPTCITGITAFLFFGYLINVIGVPVTGISIFPRKGISRR